VYGTSTKDTCSLYWQECSLLTSAVMTGVQMTDVLAGLTDWIIHQNHLGWFHAFPACAIWFNLQDLYFIPTYLVVFFICMLGLFWFFKHTLIQVIFMLHTSKGLLVSPCNICNITWNVVNTWLHLLGFCNRSSFHQCSTEFSFENSPDIEPVSSKFKFLRHTESSLQNVVF
jgi:hypothetical protein